MLRVVLIVAILAAAAGPAFAIEAGVTPQVEVVLEPDGGFRFAGPAGKDDAPTLIEIIADGEYRVTFTSGGNPAFSTAQGDSAATPIPIGLPTWGKFGTAGRWPDTEFIGNQYLTGGAVAFGRRFDIRGTGADSLTIVSISATKVVVSCSKER